MSKIQFDRNQIKGPVIVLLGKRDTGKSFLVRDILYHHQDIPAGLVMSGTEEVNPFYNSMIPRIFIHYEYNPFFIENLLKRQRQVIKKVIYDNTHYGRTNMDGRAFCILDDCLYDDKWTRDTLMRYIFMNGRHIKIMLMITMQAPLGIPPALRNNVDYAFILRNNNMNERMKIYKNYASMFPTFDSFCTILESCTNDFECLVIDNTSKSNRIEDIVFWYKADEHADFKLGSREFWEMSKTIGDEDTGAEQPLSNVRRRPNQPTITVNRVR